ncbi:hypothetical protein [Devosia sediminis]|uniref:Uncharacterized protein n=1 Tax=Devosia sediminis TaxID=2798801 RepID=A0A934IWJ4_9HYPH|nr:hypothetical protein [Devosia sediminis]MBJ3786396.1 hypothetical protein [Devosia sediminis]
MTAHELPRAEDIDAIAAAIYDADQDMLDEGAAGRLAAGDHATISERLMRLPWARVVEAVKESYRRRARAAVAAQLDTARVLLERL